MSGEYGNWHRRKTPMPRTSIVVPLNPLEQIEVRFYSKDNPYDYRSWYGTTEELRNLMNTGRRK